MMLYDGPYEGAADKPMSKGDRVIAWVFSGLMLGVLVLFAVVWVVI